MHRAMPFVIAARLAPVDIGAPSIAKIAGEGFIDLRCRARPLNFYQVIARHLLVEHSHLVAVDRADALAGRLDRNVVAVMDTAPGE